MKINLVVLIFLLMISRIASAQEYIYISEDGVRKFFRVDIGYTQWTMQQPDSAARLARGIHLLNEVKVISGFWNNDWPITVHDAFYFNLDMGLMASKQHTSVSGNQTDKESKFSMSMNMGYLLMAGYRVEKWGALGGIDFRWRLSRVGELASPNLDGPLLNYSLPLMARVEYALSKNHPEFRVMLTGWSTIGSSEKRVPYQSARLEFPLSNAGRTWLCATYTHQESIGDDNFYGAASFPTTFNQWMIGFRIGNLP